MQTVLSFIWSVLSTLVSVIWWVVSYLIWVFVWFLLPFAFVAFLALRLAERMLGEKVVRDWVKAKAMRFGAGTWERLRPLLFALGVAPFRVLVWFLVYSVWHAVVSMFWRPGWQPWTRAWAKRWRPVPRTKSGRPLRT